MDHNDSGVNNPTDITIERINDHAIVAHVPGADLPFITDNLGIARVEAEALGAWVGFARPRKARELVKRLLNLNILNSSEVCPMVGRSTRAGGRPAQELWLNREGALKFAARSDTPKAIALLDLIVRVFVHVMNQSQWPGNDNDTRDTRTEVELFRAELAALSAANGNSLAWGSEARARLLRSMCARLAKLWCRFDSSRSERAEISRVHMALRTEINYAPGRDRTLQLLTTDEFERAMRWLVIEIKRAERRIAGATRSELLPLKN